MFNARKFAPLAAVGMLGALGLTACGDDGGGGGGGGNPAAIVLVNGSEPQNKLLPANTNETGGGRIMQLLFKGLRDYDAAGKPRNQVADSITTTDSKTFTVKLKSGWKFTNGEAVTSKSFVDAWNFGALVTNAQLNASFFSPIAGYDAVHPENPDPNQDPKKQPPPTAKTMSGLKVVDDKTFTITLSKPQSLFPVQLGYTAFFPLPSGAVKSPAVFGETPVGNGPYKISGKWQHKVQIKTVVNPDYVGVEGKPKNGGVTVKFYQQFSSAYADLQSNQLDVVDGFDPEKTPYKTVKSDLGSRFINQPAGLFQSFSFPMYQAKFQGPKGALLRQAISMAIDRKSITDTIFDGTRQPATDWTSPVITGYSKDICGEFCTFDATKAKDLFKQAGGSYPGGKMTIGYNADGGHKAWVDAVCNSIKNTLGINCEGAATPIFADFRAKVVSHKMDNPFRTGWQMDWPAIDNFLQPLYKTAASSNDALYSNKALDALLDKGNQATTEQQGVQFFQDAEKLLVADMPAIPLWYQNATGGHSTNVSNVKFDVFSVPIYTEITKK